MALAEQVSRLFRQKMGIFGGLPRLQRVSDNSLIYGYAMPGKATSNPWLTEHVQVAAASADVPLVAGDLLLDRARSRYFYVIGLNPSYVGGELVRYDFQAYICNEVLTWQRLTVGPENAFTHLPSPSSYQTIQPSVRALLAIDRFWTDQATFTEEDVSQYFVFHNYVGAREGDRIVTSNGRQFIIKINDPQTFGGSLIRSSCSGGTGG